MMAGVDRAGQKYATYMRSMKVYMLLNSLDKNEATCANLKVQNTTSLFKLGGLEVLVAFTLRCKQIIE